MERKETMSKMWISIVVPSRDLKPGQMPDFTRNKITG